MLPAFSTAQHLGIDNIGADGLADRLHRPLYGGEERRTGVFYQVPAVGNLDRSGAPLSGSLYISCTTIPRDDSDRGPCGEPSGNRCCLTIGQQIDDAASLQIADDRSVLLTTLERPVIDTDYTRDLHRQRRMAPDNAQQGVLADRQEQASREALPWPSAQRQAEMMHDTLQPRRAAGKSRAAVAISRSVKIRRSSCRLRNLTRPATSTSRASAGAWWGRAGLNALAAYPSAWHFRSRVEYANVIRMMRKPVVTALQGWTLGGGAEMALAADLRIAADTTRIGFPEVQRGWVGGGGASQVLPRMIGQGQALRLLMFGEQIDAAEAALGLCEEVVPQAALLERARAIVQRLASYSPVAVQSVKASVRMSMEAPLSAGMVYENEMNVLCFGAGDHLEGIRAFNEKRPARFAR